MNDQSNMIRKINSEYSNKSSSFHFSSKLEYNSVEDIENLLKNQKNHSIRFVE